MRHDSRVHASAGAHALPLIKPQSTAIAPLLRVWEWVVATFRGVEATPVGGLLLGNAWAAHLVALPLGVRAWNLAHAARPDSLHDQALLLQECVTVVFLGLVVV